MSFIGTRQDRPIVALDVDGTIGKYHDHFIIFAEKYLGAPHEEMNPDWDNHAEFSEALMLDKQVYRDIKLAYRQGGQKRTMPLFEGAQELVAAIHDAGAEVWFCTTRPYQRLDNIDPDTREFFYRHGLDYSGLIYGENKYSDLVSIIGDKSRIVGVLEDEPMQYGIAAALGLNPTIRVGPHNVRFAEGNANVRRMVRDLKTWIPIIVQEIERWFAKERGEVGMPVGASALAAPQLPAERADCEPSWSEMGLEIGLKRTHSDHNPPDQHIHINLTSLGLTRPERVGNVFDEAQTLYRRKAAGYGDTADTLGAMGQFSDMYRKIGKLKHLLWDGNAVPEGSESIEEICMDLMGHCALTIDFLREQDEDE